jgi:hypothetical protein
VINVSGAETEEKVAEIRDQYDFVGPSHIMTPGGRQYIWLRRKSDGRLELAK